MKKHVAGFTIVELAVVVTIVALLAAISYFILSGWRVETARTEVKNDLQVIESELEAYRTFNNTYPLSLSMLEYEQTDTVDVTYNYNTAQETYCLNGKSNVEPSVEYYISTATSEHLAEGSC